MTPEILAEARAEFAAWYQAVDARRRGPWTSPGTKAPRTLETLPWCSVCGKATFVRGLCATHYWDAYRAAHRAAINAADRAYRARHREEYNRRARERKRAKRLAAEQQRQQRDKRRRQRAA